MVKNIAVCVDGSQQAEDAFEVAVDLARSQGSPLHVLTVVPVVNIYYLTAPTTPVPDEEQIRYHWELATRLIEKAKAQGVEDAGFTVLEGDPVDAILDHLEREPADLLVVGARGLSRTQRLILGSVSSALVQQAPCSVLVAKARHPLAVPPKRISLPTPSSNAGRRIRSARGGSAPVPAVVGRRAQRPVGHWVERTTASAGAHAPP